MLSLSFRFLVRTRRLEATANFVCLRIAPASALWCSSAVINVNAGPTMSGKGAKGLSGKGAKGTIGMKGAGGDKKKPISRSARAGKSSENLRLK